MSQLELQVEPDFAYVTRCVFCEAVLDVLMESDAMTPRPLNEAMLWGHVAREQHREACPGRMPGASQQAPVTVECGGGAEPSGSPPSLREGRDSRA